MFEFISIPHLTWTALLDILIVGAIIYRLLVFIKGTRAVQMAVGLGLIVAFFSFFRWVRLQTVSWMLTNILPYFVFAIIVIFQHEIRRALAHFGQAPLFSGFSSINRNEFYDEIILAVTTLTANRTGALIVIERDIGLKTYIESGIALDADLSYDLLVTIFNPSVPLHDGAVIIQNGRIAAAACFLPLTVKPRLSKELGTRHRAAIGVTEERTPSRSSFRKKLPPFLLRMTVRWSDIWIQTRCASGCAMRLNVNPQLRLLGRSPRQSSTVWTGKMRSLKRWQLWFTHNWHLKVISLVLATMLWMLVATETSSEIGMEVPLEYRNIPAQLEITGDTTNSVQVRLRGSANIIRDISARDVSTTIDLSRMRAGEKIVALSTQNVQAPFGADVIRVNPSSVRFNLERTMTKMVAVVPTISGQPAEGFEIGKVLIDPAKIEVEGPESRVNTLESIATLPIRIDRRQSYVQQTVDLDVLDPQIRLQHPSPVSVRVEIHRKSH